MSSLKSRLQQSCAHLGRFGADKDGAVAIMFALAVVPLTLMVGAALDYSGASNLRAHLQAATDGTNLKLCQIPGTPTQATLEDMAKKSLSSYLGATSYKIDMLKPTTNPRQIELTTSSTFSTAIMRGFGHETVPVGAHAKCFGEPQTFEIALVMDTTGSMDTAWNGQSKISSLRTAATKFVNYIYDHPVMSQNTKMSLVPFAGSVALPTSYRTASFVDQLGLASYHWNVVKGGKVEATKSGFVNRFGLFDKLKASQSSWDWKGCFESLAYPFNTKDAAPTVSQPDSYFVPMFAPDESGDGGQLWHQDANKVNVLGVNSYIDDSTSNNDCKATMDESDRIGRPCKYVKPTDSKTASPAGIPNGPGFMCTSRPLTRLTTSRSTLLNEIRDMPTGGNTDIHEGFMWGWRTISPNSVFASDASSYTKKYNNKVVILMTDGENTWTTTGSNRLQSYYSAYGYLKNPDGSGPNVRLPPANKNPTTAAHARAAIDALTLEGCKNALAPPNNVVIYSVGFSTPNDAIDQQGLDLLKACAGEDKRFFKATTGDELVSVFQQIAQDIGGLRLTN